MYMHALSGGSDRFDYDLMMKIYGTQHNTSPTHVTAYDIFNITWFNKTEWIFKSSFKSAKSANTTTATISNRSLALMFLALKLVFTIFLPTSLAQFIRCFKQIFTLYESKSAMVYPILHIRTVSNKFPTQHMCNLILCEATITCNFIGTCGKKVLDPLCNGTAHFQSIFIGNLIYFTTVVCILLLTCMSQLVWFGMLARKRVETLSFTKKKTYRIHI